MLRQLARLTRPLPAAGPRALAIAVYGSDGDRPIAAAESGFEGVACVDDAARACELLCDVWAATGSAVVREWAEGLLQYVTWMQAEPGLWFNFVLDWDGARNRSGPTSGPGVNFWQARALNALAAAWTVLGDEPSEAALAAGLKLAEASECPPDLRALQVQALLRVLRHQPTPEMLSLLSRWCEELVSCRRGDFLLNSAQETQAPHLWGHLQEAVLAEASVLLARPDLLRVAEAGADALFSGLIESGFAADHVQPYGVQMAVEAMDRLHGATGSPARQRLGGLAREWFAGRNAARLPVYDQEQGRVADGIDFGVLNRHSGAESNIAAGMALFGAACHSVQLLPLLPWSAQEPAKL